MIRLNKHRKHQKSLKPVMIVKVNFELSYTKTEDTITVQFDKEAESIYNYSVKDYFRQSKLKLVKKTSSKLADYEVIAQVGSLAKILQKQIGHQVNITI